MSLNSQTVMYGVMGDPIGHSKSPLMMNHAFQVCGLNAAYAAFGVKRGQLDESVRGIKALGFGGFNVTIPYKVEVMASLDEITEGARVIGAVNTIVNHDGKLIGYNTDGIGYVRSLCEETGLSLSNKRVLLIGAGGAARGIAYALAQAGVSKLWISNRTKAKADELAAYIGQKTQTQPIESKEIADIIEQVDLVVNNTSVGMHPNINETPIDSKLLHARLIVSDIVYTPMETRLLQEAKARGAMVHGGLGMFIYQGAYAFEYWTGLKAPVQEMREIVLKSFKE